MLSIQKLRVQQRDCLTLIKGALSLKCVSLTPLGGFLCTAALFLLTPFEKQQPQGKLSLTFSYA